MYFNQLELIDNENILIFHDREGNPSEIGRLEDSDVYNNSLHINGRSYPLDANFPNEEKIIRVWNAIFPNGRPKPPTPDPGPSELDLLRSQISDCYQTISDLMDIVVLKEE